MDAPAFFLCAAYRYCRVSFPHVIILLFLMPIKVGSGFCPTSKAAGGMPAAMLAFPEGKIFLGHRRFSPLSIVSVLYRHTRSTLRDNRFHRRR